MIIKLILINRYLRYKRVVLIFNSIILVRMKAVVITRLGSQFLIKLMVYKLCKVNS